MDPAFVKTDKKKPHTEFEKQLLLNLVQTRLALVDSRRTDAVTLRKKQEAWDDLAREFNNTPNVSQINTSKQLKKMWQNLKTKARDAKTLEGQRKKTGGGPPPPEMGPLENQVLAIMPTVLPSISIDIDSDILNSEDREEEADDDSAAWLHKKTLNKSIKDQPFPTPLPSTFISIPSNTPVTSTCPLSFTSSSIPLITHKSSNPVTCTYTPFSDTVMYNSSPVPSPTPPITVSSIPPTTINQRRGKKRANDEDKENLSVEDIRKKIYLEELQNAREVNQMQKEFIKEKNRIEIEILNIKKEILLKQLNN